MKDIETRDDVENLVNAFYQKVMEDEIIGYIFSDIAKINWEKHLPIMYDFWETVLFGAMKYKGNPMLKHIAINNLETLTEIHFERWLLLWKATIQEHFSGPKSDEAFNRAKMMADLMEYKIQQSKNSGFIQ